MKYDRSKIDEKALAEFQWKFTSAQKETFALAREFGNFVVARDLDPEQGIAAAVFFIWLCSGHLPQEERHEALLQAAEDIVEWSKNIDDPV